MLTTCSDVRLRVIPIVPALLTALAACDWISLVTNAVGYETLVPGEAGNVVATDSLAYAAIGDSGIAIVNALTGRRIALVSPPAGAESIDDVSITDGYLFVLDARAPGYLAVMSLKDARSPRLIGAARAVAVGPFSGVSAANGIVIVSGGTSSLSAWRYDSTGTLAGPVATLDLGRGQPDVLATSSHLLLVSTHHHGPRFGVDLARLAISNSLTLLGRMELDEAGFTAGGTKPANFPIESGQLDDSTFVVAFSRGLAKIMVAHDGQLRLDRIIDVGGPAVNVDLLGPTAAVAVAGKTGGIVLLDLSAEPRVLKEIALPPGTIPSGVALTSRSVIVAARRQGILALQR
jgi:hypothetical protein